MIEHPPVTYEHAATIRYCERCRSPDGVVDISIDMRPSLAIALFVEDGGTVVFSAGLHLCRRCSTQFIDTLKAWHEGRP